MNREDMLQLVDGDIRLRVEPILRDARRSDRMPNSILVSAAFHGLAVLLVIGVMRSQVDAPAELTQIVPIMLVQLGEETASPGSEQLAPVPQDRAKETAVSESQTGIPISQSPPSQTERNEHEAGAAPDLNPAISQRKPDIPKPHKAPKAGPPPVVEQPSPADAFVLRLQRLAKLQQPVLPLHPDPRRQQGAGSSNVTTTSENADRSEDASYGVKDFLRAQITRRWAPDVGRVSGNWVVAIHIVLRPDGQVSRAEIVDDPQYHSNSAYLDFALSARNAVLLSSPLSLPPGVYDIEKNITLDFDSRHILQ